MPLLSHLLDLMKEYVQLLGVGILRQGGPDVGVVSRLALPLGCLL